MKLRRLSIIDYKNIRETTLMFSPKINCFIGDNGVGKTNLLDAVYYLSFCRSAVTAVDSQVVNHDADFFVLEGEYTSDAGDEEHIYCGMKRGTKKRFKRNGKDYKRLSEHLGLIPVVLVSPSDTLLIEGLGEERRRFMDVVISQYDREYIDALNSYNKALQQRNIMLRQDDEPDAELMTILEEQMARCGCVVFAKRDELISKLTPIFQAIYHYISGDREEVSIAYTSHCHRGDLLEIIRGGRDKDRILGYSTHGIHRDDMEVLIDGFPMKREGSQGQNKTFVIALKLAQFDLLRGVGTAETPLLLLDDIFDKLDAQRVERIVGLVAGDHKGTPLQAGDHKGTHLQTVDHKDIERPAGCAPTVGDCYGQIFITDTNRDHLDRILSAGAFDYRLFNVVNGEIKE